MTARIETRATVRGGVVQLRWVAIVLVALGFVAIAPLAGPLVLAIWTATMLEPLTHRFAKRLGGRGRAGMVLTALVVVLILAPLVVTGIAVAGAVSDLRNIRQSSDVYRLLVPAEFGPSLENLNPQRLGALVRRYGGEAMQTLQAAFGLLTAAAIGLVVYLFGVFECIAKGPRAAEWLRERALVSRATFTRLSGAFVETGHGLFIGIGGTALLQTVVATIGYAVVGLPQALLLGFVTLFASLIPSVGTGLVWAPVTAVLFASGRNVAAVVLLCFGCAAAVIDNVVRPWLSRYGRLRLPTYVILVAMLGGIVIFGGFGLIFGPLFVRLGVEALDIWRDRHRATAA